MPTQRALKGGSVFGPSLPLEGVIGRKVEEGAVGFGEGKNTGQDPVEESERGPWPQNLIIL